MKTATSVALLYLLPVLMAASFAAAGPAIAVIVNRSNPAEDLSRNQVRDILIGNVRQWPNRRRIVIAHRDPGSHVLSTVLREILGSSIPEYNRLLLNLEFRGSEPVPVKTLNSDEAACAFVFNVPGSIAFIEASSLDRPACASNVKTVEFDRKRLGSPEYRFR